MVPVRADDTDGSLTAGGAGSSTRARSRAGSSAGSSASSTAGEVANLSEVTTPDADGTDGSSAAPETGSGEGASSGGTDASLTVSTDADGTVASSAEGAATSPDAGSGVTPDSGTSEGDDDNAEAVGNAAPAPKVVLGSLFLDEGSTVVEYTEGLYDKTVLDAKKADAMGFAEEARKTAEKLKEAAEKMIKEADELSKAAEKATKVDELAAKLEDSAYKVGVERSQASEFAKPPDMMIYTGFPDGHHRLIDHASLVRLYKLHRWEHGTMYYDGFPNGWHGLDFANLDAIEKDAKEFRKNKYAAERDAKKMQILSKEAEISAKDKQIAEKDAELKHKHEAVEVKNRDLEAKRKELADLRELITELTRQLRELESEARTLNSEHSKLFANYKVLELDRKKLEDDKKKLHHEHSVLEEEDRNIVRAFYELSGRTSHFDGKPTATDAHVDPRDNFSSFTEELGLVEAGEGAEASMASGEAESEPADSGSAAPALEEDNSKVAGVSADASLPVASEGASETADAKAAGEAESTAQVAEAAPAAEEVASTSVAAPANEEPASDAQPAEGAAHVAEGTQAVPATVRLFKTDAYGADVEMTEADFTKKHVTGDDKYEFKDNVKCVKVRFGENDVWKKGDEGVNEPKFVGFNDSVKALVVRDNDKNVVYKKESDSDKWKHLKTVARQSGHGHGRNAAHSGSSATSSTAPASSAESAPEPGSLSTPLAGSKLNLAEAEDTSSVSSEGSETDAGTGLRGAGAAV